MTQMTVAAFYSFARRRVGALISSRSSRTGRAFWKENGYARTVNAGSSFNFLQPLEMGGTKGVNASSIGLKK